MNNNDILRRLRFAFDFSDRKASELFSLDPASSASMSAEQLKARLLKDGEDGFQPCSDPELMAFLDGLIVLRRGLREPPPGTTAVKGTQAAPQTKRLSKNDILKKLRIAMNFREAEMLHTLQLGGSKLSKSELGALFRNPRHKHFRACGNQVLRAFIKGLTQQLRPSVAASPETQPDNRGS